VATQAQIDANRRNASKSTGPKSEDGKRVSSRNATRHGLTASIPLDDVRARADVIFAAAAEPIDRSARELLEYRTLRLAEAEARLERARKAERSLLSKSDGDLRLRKELHMILDRLWEDAVLWRQLSPAEARKGYRYAMRAISAGARFARIAYSRQLRYLREAEAEHAAALRAWLDAS
jgi:hypothetical protein